jgi:hypothetical protein
MKTTKNLIIPLFALLIIGTFFLAGWTPRLNVTHTREPTQLLAQTSTPVPLPMLTLKPGNFYFSLDGHPAIIFSRNFLGPILGEANTKTALEWAHQGGTQLIRVHLTGWWGIPPMKNDGTVNETWAQNWDWFFDQAKANGIYVLPVFGVCADWNDAGWKYNPLNQVNGGYLTDPKELFKPDSITQNKWMAWVQTLVQRWQGRENILGWEIFSEINIASGAPFTPGYKSAVTETAAVDFITRAASIIRAADTFDRPTTASLEGFDKWPTFLRSKAIDFLNIHPYPYPPNLDTFIIEKTRDYIAAYQKPVLIGESGLSGAAPNTVSGKITNAKRAPIGISHAIWAGVVSGAMNGRGLFWEDSYALAIQGMDFSFLEKYAQAESATAAFVDGMDFTGFNPLTAQYSAKITGAVLGNEGMVIGWFRDAKCEPPDWNTQLLITGQKVTITLPGTKSTWLVKFYDTKTGTEVIDSTTLTVKGNKIIIPLPDFRDDVAFKMFPLQ